MPTWAENWAAIRENWARLTASCAAIKSEAAGLVGRLREAFAAAPETGDVAEAKPERDDTTGEE